MGAIRARVLLLAALVLLAAVLACSEADPPSPTATGTPGPTASPTPTPAGRTFSGPTALEVASDLLGAIPAGHSSFLYLDLGTILADPVLAQVFRTKGGLDALGPSAAFIEGMAETIVLARGEGVVLGVLQRPTDPGALVASIESFGAPVQTSAYGAHQIIEVAVDFPFLSLSLAASFPGEGRGIFAASSSAAAPVADGVKAVLDILDGSGDGSGDGPEDGAPGVLTRRLQDLLSSVPGGPAVAATMDCGALSQKLAVPIDIAGESADCIGVAVSAAFEEGETALDLAIGFTSPVPADIIENLIEEDLQRLGGQSGTVGQVQVFGSGSLILIRAVVDTEAAMDRAFDFGGL